MKSFKVISDNDSSREFCNTHLNSEIFDLLGKFVSVLNAVKCLGQPFTGSTANQ